MFNIEFIDTGDSKDLLKLSEQAEIDSKTGRSDELKTPVGYGLIVIGSFVERFESPLQYWRKKEYEEQWHNAISRLLAGSKKTALITAMYDPATANFLTWWPLYRVAETIFIHNQLLFLSNLNKPFSIEEMDELVGPRHSVDDESTKISEWSVPLADIDLFWQRV